MKYDKVMTPHRHLYCSECERIKDFDDTELNTLLKEYFVEKQIPGFEILDIKLQIIGRFLK